MLPKLILATLCCLVLVPLQGETLSVEELKGQYDGELEDLRVIVRTLQKRLMLLEDTVVAPTDRQNNTEELEARVTVLEETVSDLEIGFVSLMDDMDNVESANLIQDDRLNIIESDISDNENDIEELVDITTGLTGEVLALDQRVSDLEESGGGNANVTDLTERVELLEEVTSELTNDVSSLEDNDVTQDERISGIEEDVTSLDQRVEDLESGGGGSNITDYGDTVFLAALSTSQSSSENPLIFDREVINPGGHYNSTAGKYTVPYDGIYQFSVHLTGYTSSAAFFFRIYVDDSSTGSHIDNWTHGQYRSTTLLLELQAGQTVHVYLGNGAYGDSISLRSYFSGHMISAN